MRKMIKWKPFYSIKGLDNIIYENTLQNSKITKPTILNSEVINYNLQTAINENLKIIIKYFDYGFLKIIEGKIEKIDLIYKYLIIDSKRIYFKNIITLDIK